METIELKGWDRPGLGEEACTEARCRFAEELKQLSAMRDVIRGLESRLANYALMMNLSAVQTVIGNRLIDTDDGQWHKNIDCFDNLFACHRFVGDSVEYAIVEHFPEAGTNEIWVRGWSSVEVMHAFVKDQYYALQMYAEDVAAQIREYLSEHYPGQNLDIVDDSFCLAA